MAAPAAYVALRDADSPPRVSRARASPPWLAPGLCAVALIEAVVVSVMAARASQPAGAATYRTLGQEPSPVAVGTIRVVPDPAMALTDWNALLHVLQLRIVGGPDKAGAYLVAPLNRSVSSRRILEQLRGIHGVRLAEPAREP